MMVWLLFIIDLMGLFFLQQNRLHNIYRGFTHYKYYRANKYYKACKNLKYPPTI